MSKKLVTKEIPDILPVLSEDLSAGEKYILIHCYKHNIGEPFVICTRGRETILINKSLPSIEETIQLINKIMAMKYLDKAENLFDQFKNLHGENASDVLLYIWMDWREKRNAVEINKRSVKVLDEIGKSRLKRKFIKEKDIINELFSIGFGTYDGEAKCDWDTGKKYVFLYGYLLGMKQSAQRGGATHA